MEINIGAFNTLLKTVFNNNQAEMGRKLGVSKSQINVIIRTKGRNAGKKVIGGIIKFCKENNLDFMDYIFLP